MVTSGTTPALAERMSDSHKVHVTFNLVMDVHLEMARWMARVHVPRKIASRIENATTSAAISLSSAVSCTRSVVTPAISRCDAPINSHKHS